MALFLSPLYVDVRLCECGQNKPTVVSRSHWTIAIQVSRSPFKIRENFSRLFTHLGDGSWVLSEDVLKIPEKDFLGRLLRLLDELEAGHAKLDGDFIVHFQCHKLVLL